MDGAANAGDGDAWCSNIAQRPASALVCDGEAIRRMSPKLDILWAALTDLADGLPLHALAKPFRRPSGLWRRITLPCGLRH